MTPAFSARRRADEFEALLSRRSDAPLSERDAARFAALLDVVGDLRALPDDYSEITTGESVDARSPLPLGDD